MFGLLASVGSCRPGGQPPPVGDSIWYPTRINGSAFNLSSIPYSGYVETAPPVTTTSSTASSGAAVTTAAGVAGRHVTVDPGTACGDITISANDVRITFGAGCTVGTIYLTNCNRVWIEGNTSGTRTLLTSANGAGNFLTTFMATASNIAVTNVDMRTTGFADNNNNILAMDTWTFAGCRLKAQGTIAVNFIGDGSNVLIANCNFFTGTGAESRWNVRNTANGDRHIVILDSDFSNSASSYGLIRIGGTGWWIDNCQINGSTEITLQGDQTATNIYFSGNRAYRTTSFAGNGTMTNINITDNIFYASGWTSDADIISNLSGASGLTVSGNSFPGTNATLTTWTNPPGDPTGI